MYIMKLKGLCECRNDPVACRTDFIDSWLEESPVRPAVGGEASNDDVISRGMG